MSRILSLVPKWQVIKTIGGSKFVAVAGFFPFVGYLVVANVNFAESIVLITDQINGDTSIDLVHDRLMDIYFGMLSLSIGVILYKIFCPKSVSMFKDHYDFMDKELPTVTPLRVERIQEEMRSPLCLDPPFYPTVLRSEISEMKRLKLNDTSINEFSFPGSDGSKSASDYQTDEGISLINLLTTYFHMNDSSLGIVRLLTSGFFAYGYYKLAWPSISVALSLLGLF